MEFIFDILAEAFFELFGEGFVALSSVFVPQKEITPKRKATIGYVCLAVSLVLLAGLVVGVILLVETKGQSVWGRLAVVVSLLYLLTGILLKIIFCVKNRR